MRFSSLIAIAAAPLVSAINFTAPAGGETFSKGASVTAKWSSVDTDPTTFSLYLWNFVNFPPFYEPLAFDVPTSSGSVTVRIPCSVNASAGYQLTAINGTNVYVIYAQSGKFTIGGSACTDPTSIPSTCAATKTVTVTAAGSCATNGTLSTTYAPTGTGSSYKTATATGTATGTSKPTVTPITVNSASSAGFTWVTISFGFMLAAFML